MRPSIRLPYNACDKPATPASPSHPSSTPHQPPPSPTPGPNKPPLPRTNQPPPSPPNKKQVAGSFVGALADNFGRKKMCVMYAVFYAISCVLKLINSYYLLMVRAAVYDNTNVCVALRGV